MNAIALQARLYVIGASVLLLLGGMMFAIGRWDAAEDDRAFVEAAALAARTPDPAPLPPRYWAPTVGARPGPEATQRIEAAEQLRTAPPPQAAPAAPPRPPQPPQAPGGGKTPAVVR